MSMDQEPRNFYQILGIDRHASQDQIKKAYKRLAILYHPDKNLGEAGSTIKSFRQIAEAYETLSDVDRRNSYDVAYIQGVTFMDNQNKYKFQDAETLFKSFFKNTNSRYFNSGQGTPRTTYINGKRTTHKPTDRSYQSTWIPTSPFSQESSSKDTDNQFDEPFTYLTDIGGDGISKSVSTMTKTINGKTVTMRRTTIKKRDGTKDVTEETIDDGNVEVKNYSLGIGEGFGRKAVH